MIDCKGKNTKKASNYQKQFYYAFLMSRLSQFHHSRIAPWELEDANLQAEHFSPHRMILTPKKREVHSCNSPKRSSQSKSKLQPNRTAVKITRINISPDKSTYPKANRDPFSTYTPKNNHIGIFQRKARRASPELSSCTPAKHTIMTIDTWREESKRILSSMSKKKVGDRRYNNRQSMNKTIGAERSQINNLRMLEKFLAESSLGDSLLVYKKPKTQHPNISRFKMLQLQKKLKF